MGAPNILIYKEGEMVHRERGASNLSTQLEVNKFLKNMFAQITIIQQIKRQH